jgi:peroxiredoxin
MRLSEELRALETASRAKRDPAVQDAIERMIADLDAEAVAAEALSVGETAPDFELPDLHGRRVALADLLSTGPAVLVFYRGAWCPYCNLQLRAFQRALPRIRAAGASLVAISPQSLDRMESTAAQEELGFPLLSDLGNRTARLYGLAWRIPDDIVRLYARRGIDFTRLNGTAEAELPLAASYVVGSDGLVRLAQVDVDFRQRADPEDIVAVLARGP